MHSSLLNQLKSVDSPFSLLEIIKNNNKLITELNKNAELGHILCQLVLKSFGLGIKALINSGLDLSACVILFFKLKYLM